MEITFTKEDVIEWFGQILHVEPQESEGTFTYSSNRAEQEWSGSVNSSEIDEIISNLNNKEIEEETTLYDANSLEVLIRYGSAFPPPLFFRRRESDFSIRDEDNGISYSFSEPTNEYLVFLLFKISQISSIDAFSRWTRVIMRRIEDEGEITVFSLIRASSFRYPTLKISTDQPTSLTQLSKLTDSFLFQLGYNLDFAIIPQRFLDEIARLNLIGRMKRSKLDDLDAPKRYYNRDLIYHYQMAIATDSPLLEFLSYYHVAEHFFEGVFTDELIEKVKNKITLPSFSYKRKKDIKSLITDISKALKFRGENVTFSEVEALSLTIEKFVSIPDLLDKVRDYDESLVDYYRTQEVVFSKGDIVDLEDSDVSKVSKSIANRIYKTRNAIVHSKEGEKARFIPFKHDRVLVKEIPLLRFISEMIIIETSETIA